jgi:hypothetical protein
MVGYLSLHALVRLEHDLDVVYPLERWDKHYKRYPSLEHDIALPHWTKLCEHRGRATACMCMREYMAPCAHKRVGMCACVRVCACHARATACVCVCDRVSAGALCALVLVHICTHGIYFGTLGAVLRRLLGPGGALAALEYVFRKRCLPTYHAFFAPSYLQRDRTRSTVGEGRVRVRVRVLKATRRRWTAEEPPPWLECRALLRSTPVRSSPSLRQCEYRDWARPSLPIPVRCPGFPQPQPTTTPTSENHTASTEYPC